MIATHLCIVGAVTLALFAIGCDEHASSRNGSPPATVKPTSIVACLKIEGSITTENGLAVSSGRDFVMRQTGATIECVRVVHLADPTVYRGTLSEPAASQWLAKLQALQLANLDPFMDLPPDATSVSIGLRHKGALRMYVLWSGLASDLFARQVGRPSLQKDWDEAATLLRSIDDSIDYVEVTDAPLREQLLDLAFNVNRY